MNTLANVQNPLTFEFLSELGHGGGISELEKTLPLSIRRRLLVGRCSTGGGLDRISRMIEFCSWSRSIASCCSLVIVILLDFGDLSNSEKSSLVRDPALAAVSASWESCIFWSLSRSCTKVGNTKWVGKSTPWNRCSYNYEIFITVRKCKWILFLTLQAKDLWNFGWSLVNCDVTLTSFLHKLSRAKWRSVKMKKTTMSQRLARLSAVTEVKGHFEHNSEIGYFPNLIENLIVINFERKLFWNFLWCRFIHSPCRLHWQTCYELVNIRMDWDAISGRFGHSFYIYCFSYRLYSFKQKYYARRVRWKTYF